MTKMLGINIFIFILWPTFRVIGAAGPDATSPEAHRGTSGLHTFVMLFNRTARPHDIYMGQGLVHPAGDIVRRRSVGGKGKGLAIGERLTARDKSAT
ncbi:MAG: hypothetical protein QGH15_22020 [Kiritimatiellia bacterium]|nr:hypothetical protein [Kiritimatiellia bacterium]